jgi:hypothetical protein
MLVHVVILHKTIIKRGSWKCGECSNDRPLAGQPYSRGQLRDIQARLCFSVLALAVARSALYALVGSNSF